MIAKQTESLSLDEELDPCDFSSGLQIFIYTLVKLNIITKHHESNDKVKAWQYIRRRVFTI